MSLTSAYDQIAPSTAIIAQQQAARTFTGVQRRDPGGRGRLAATVIKLLEDADEVIDRDRDAARACIARASALLRDDIRPAHAPAALVQGGLAPWQISRVKAHVEAHFDSTLRMCDLAAIARLSAGHFSRSFTRSFGVAPFAYVAGRRLARAQELMLTTDDPLSQIALACGLCDQSHLTRLFRRHVGTSPNVWRRTHRSDPAALSPVLSTPNPKPRYLPARTKPATSPQMYACAQPYPGCGWATCAGKSNRRIAMVKMALTATLATAVFASGAQAAPACGKRDDVLAQLSERYREAPVGIGVAGNGGLIELLTASTGATWTLLITLPNGPTCLLAAGQDWQPLQTAMLVGPGI